ncbi:cache domain-containing sensor histidine kinase [Paenibacillus spongiae]|uniref:Sensor histidine kinase n=1 Tax=Paenibacillus spongiae TaxID=2909671 RepID=A0ABY5S9P8_9BACL|nr:sensor histidine kinase [Paenibacillus spongiae]UVI30647.1 sensor histidine kinase [Paenibacillus spongiae]
MPIRLIRTIQSRLLYKMLIIYSILTLVPLSIVSAAYYVRSDQLLEKKDTEAVQQNLNETASRIDTRLYEVRKRLSELGQQESILSLLAMDAKAGADAAEGDRSRLEAAATELMQSELEQARSQVGDFIDNIYLISKSGSIYATDESKRLQYVEAFRLLPFEFKGVPQWAFFTDHKRMACDLKLYAEGAKMTSGTEIGMLVLTVDPVNASQLYETYESGTFYIANADNLILSSAELSDIGELIGADTAGDSLVVRQKSQYADFQYIGLAKVGASTLVKKQALFALAVTLAAWVAVVIATYQILRRITNPIRRLNRLMRKAELEEYQVYQQVKGRDEIAMLCRGYNQLVTRTEQLIETNYKNELKVREAELKAIRMYINPHFLYNILEYISIISQSPEKAKYVPDVVQKLSGIFRFSITPGDIYVPLETELIFVEKYLQIHQYRFGERLGYSVNLPAMFRNVAVPRLILQPLVENSIIHGIDRLQGGGRIDIEAREEDYHLAIEIRNHSPEPESPEAEDDPPPPRRREDGGRGLGSGMDNVNDRIRHHFGSGYGAVLTREAGSVTVKVTLPIQIWQGEGI